MGTNQSSLEKRRELTLEEEIQSGKLSDNMKNKMRGSLSSYRIENLYEYTDERLDYRQTILFLSIKHKNYEIIEYLISVNVDIEFIILHSKPKLHQLIDDRIFSLLILSAKEINVMHLILFSFDCNRFHLFVENKHRIKYVKTNKEIGHNNIIFTNFTYHMIKIINDELKDDKLTLEFIIDYLYNRENTDYNEVLHEFYKLIRDNNEFNIYLFSCVCFSNNVKLLKLLIDEGYNLPLFKFSGRYQLSNKLQTNVEVFELLSSCENFDDFIQLNKEYLCQHLNEESKRYIESII